MPVRHGVPSPILSPTHSLLQCSVKESAIQYCRALQGFLCLSLFVCVNSLAQIVTVWHNQPTRELFSQGVYGGTGLRHSYLHHPAYSSEPFSLSFTMSYFLLFSLYSTYFLSCLWLCSLFLYFLFQNHPAFLLPKLTERDEPFYVQGKKIELSQSIDRVVRHSRGVRS